jgi:hypothetical protein
VRLVLGGLSSARNECCPYAFDPVKLPPACSALRAEVREFIAAELAAGLWVPNIDFGSRRSRRSAGDWARGWIGMTWPKALRRRGAQVVDRAFCRLTGSADDSAAWQTQAFMPF